MELMTLLACASATPSLAQRSAAAPHVVIRSVLLPGGTDPIDVEMADGSIEAIGPQLDVEGAEEIDATGHWLAPAFIDSHVHLAYRTQAAEMAQGGVAAAIDLAAPIEFLAALPGDLEVLASGPMITAPSGYPTQSWGAAGYGWEVADADEARAAVSALHAAGARVIKLPVTSEPVLDDETLTAAAAASHALGLKVATHATSDEHALRAANAGADVLAHTPTGALSAETCAAWRDRAVISTLLAFGGADTTLENLADLHERGATVLYGTDFGNTQTAGIDAGELALLMEAGLSPAEILAAGTSVPAAWWGLDHLGAIEAGKDASVLLLERDPLADPLTLAAPVRVWIGGIER